MRRLIAVIGSVSADISGSLPVHIEVSNRPSLLRSSRVRLQETVRLIPPAMTFRSKLATQFT